VIIRQYFPAIGGAQSQARRLARGLSDKGWRVLIFTQELSSSHVETATACGAEVVRISAPSLRCLGSVIFLFKLFFHLVSRRAEIDVLLGFFLKQSSAAAVIASKTIGKRIVLRPACSGAFGDIETAARVPFGRLWLRICRRADAFIAISSEIKKEMVEAGFDDNRISLVANGVEVIPESGSEKRLLKKRLGLGPGLCAIFTGRLSVQKRPDLLLEAFSALKQIGDLSLVIIGDGPLYPQLKKKAAQGGLQEKVLLLKTREDVRDYLSAGDIFVLPSVSEGMSVSLLEAMAAGLAVIASDIPANSHVVENEKNGLLFKSGDADGLVCCLERLLGSEELRRFFGENARRTIARNYSLEKMIEAYDNILVQSISGRGGF